MKTLLSYDGHGINGTDEYRTRLATFTGPEGRSFGPLFAAAPELLEALENAGNVLAGIATGDLKTIDKDSPALKKAREAIKKAKEGTQ